MLRWLNFSAPSRRRAAAQWHSYEVGQTAEVLEIRAAPAKASPLPPGYYDDGSEEIPTSITVYPPGKGGQFADVFVHDFGNVTCKVHAKKDGSFLLVIHTNHAGGSIKMTPSGPAGHYDLRINVGDAAGDYRYDSGVEFSHGLT